MADYTQLMNLEKKPKKQVTPPPAQQSSSSQSTEQSINQSTDQSINRLPERLTNRFTHPTSIKVMDKPRGFYITEQLNKRIDEAVRYYQEKHNLKKVDRSIVVTALLDNETNWTEEALDLLLDRILNQLTSRLTNQSINELTLFSYFYCLDKLTAFGILESVEVKISTKKGFTPGKGKP